MGNLNDPMVLGDLPHQLTTIGLSAARNVGAALVVYFFTLAAYRVFFHPLAKHPGPFWAKLTDWYVGR